MPPSTPRRAAQRQRPLTVAAALALACAWVVPAHAQADVPRAVAQAQPGAVELDFWRSAERMGTPDAYRAYLAAFPEGFFAPLARAALAQAGAQRAARQAAVGASSALRYFSAPLVHSGAVAFNLGDRFTGPGVLTIGWLGAKRQVVVPPGEWVVLAMADDKVDMTPPAYRFPTRVVADIGTLVLGRFSGARLSSAMVYRSSIRQASVDGWTDIAGCQPGNVESLFHENKAPSGLRSTCAAIKPVAAPLAVNTPAMTEARASLERLGAQVAGDALATIAEVSEPRRGYLAGTRLDWPGVTLGPGADTLASWTRAAVASDPKRAATVTGLIEWLGVFRKLVDDAYGFRIDQEDLKAGAGVPPTGSPISLRDFQPG